MIAMTVCAAVPGSQVRQSNVDDRECLTVGSDGGGRSAFPVWSVGDEFQYVQTYYDTSMYSSYSYESTSRVENITTCTTPEGTFDVYGLSSRSYSVWVGKPPYSSGYFYSNGSSYYRTSDLAAVVSTYDSVGPTYYSHSYTYYKPPKDTWDYPIEVNETWNVSTTYHYVNSGVASGTPYHNEGDYTYDTDYHSLSQTSIAVKGGNFSVFKIRSSTSPTTYMIYYFDPNMGWSVRSETYTDGTLYSALELNYTTFVHGPSASGGNFDFTMQEDRVDTTTINLNDIFSSEKNLTFTAEASSSMNVTIQEDGTVEFRPKRNWHGSATVTFRADDGLKNATKEVAITVTSVNDPPFFDDLPDITFYEGGSDDSLDLDDYVGDVDNDLHDLTFSIEPAENIIARLIAGNVVEFTSSGNWYGEEYVGVRARDEDAYSNVMNVLVTVTKINDAPIMEDVGGQTVLQYGYLNLTLAASDPDYLDTLSFQTNMSEAIEGVFEGSEYFLDESAGEFSFHPCEQSLVGDHEIAFWTSDGTARDHSNITITVENVNDPPLVEEDFYYVIIDADPVTFGDNNLTVCFSTPLVSDMDGDEISFEWDFGDGSQKTSGRNVNYTYAEPGDYTVSLEITDGMIGAPIVLTDTVSVTAPVVIPGDDDNEDDGEDDDEDDAADDAAPDDDIPTDEGGNDDDDSDGVADDDSDNGDAGDDDRAETGDSRGSSFLLWGLLFIIVLSMMIVAVIVVIIMKVSGSSSDNDHGMLENDPVFGGQGQFTGYGDPLGPPDRTRGVLSREANMGRIAGPHETSQTEYPCEVHHAVETSYNPNNGWQTSNQYSPIQDPWKELR